MKRKRLMLVLAFCALGLATFAWLSARQANELTNAKRRPVPPRSETPLAMAEPVEFPSMDGIRLCGWWLPSDQKEITVILLHGHGSNRRQMIARAEFLHRRGHSVLLYDARGHGESAGELVSFGFHETNDLLGAMEFARKQGSKRFGLIGASQGGATIALCGRRLRDVEWAVLESVYLDLRTAVDRRCRYHVRLPGWLLGSLMVPLAERTVGVAIDQISPRAKIGEFSFPVFIVSGNRDRHTLPEDTQALFDAASAPKSLWIVEGAGHVDLYGFAKQLYEDRLLAFIELSQSQTSRLSM